MAHRALPCQVVTLLNETLVETDGVKFCLGQYTQSLKVVATCTTLFCFRVWRKNSLSASLSFL